MDISKFFKKEYVIGLDIGSSSVKMAQFIEDELGALHLERTGLKEEEDVVLALEGLLGDIDLKKAKVIVTVNCPQTDVKKLTAPLMPKAELREGVKLAAKNYFPFPIDDSFLDFEILGDTLENGIKKYEVALAACPKKTVDKYLAILKKANIKPAALVPASYALKKSSEKFSTKENKLICLIDIGKTYTELLILKGSYPEFSRKIPVSGDDFTRALTQVLASDKGKVELSFTEAEKIKREIGIPLAGEAKVIDGKISTAQISSMLRTPLENLVSEVARSLDYYREKNKSAGITQIILSGGGATLAGLDRVLSEGLGIDVKLADSPRFVTAVGAALDVSKGVNLLPPEIKNEPGRVMRRGVFEGLVTALVLSSIFFYVGLKIKLDSLEKRISAAKLEITSLQFKE